MKNSAIAVMALAFCNACFADIDCANASANNALIYCSKKGLQESESKFKSSLERLSASTWVPKKSGADLIILYKRSSSLSKTVCASIFPSGRLRKMYINDCVSMQLDKLVDSMNSYICTQQDADGCR